MRSPVELPDGALRVDATLTRTGVFVYRDSAGNEFREYRPPEEVFDEASIASFEGLVITDDHPPVMVDAANVTAYKRGRNAGVKRDGIHMTGTLIIEDATLRDKMRNGKREVSNGYACELDMVAGVSPDGEKYDAIQRKIRGNHIAIVDMGRAGTARARMDGAAEQVTDTASVQRAGEQSTAAAAAHKGDRMDLTQALAALHAANEKVGTLTEKLGNESKRADAAEQRAKEADAAKTTAEAKADQADVKAKAAETAKAEAETAAAKAKTDATDAQKASIKARVSLVTTAMTAGVTSCKVDGKDIDVSDASDRDIRLAVIAKLDGAEVPAEKRDSDAYVEARFDLAKERAGKTRTAFDQLNAVVNDPAKHVTTDNADDDKEAKARAKMRADSRNAYTTPLTTTTTEVK